ncbi:ATP-binding cassette sub-family G member 4-like [Oppia nitens]|uniref:ATP-binding cassette sub-family G member 4-like n=1 Tax=Oppia nitens TaxID=1686743 RepID=UPI0023D9D9DC|nr:ATP-binding cassette sub-family G member 4-like [Oppia nitens]
MSFKNDLAIAWIDLSYGKKDWFSKHSKVILNSLNGRINYHTLTALMGPSGAGKSTLLKCINMRQTSGITCDSKIYVNQCTDFKTCFIMQSSDEHLWLGLTVRESLLFASKIKNYKIKYWEESYDNMRIDFIDEINVYQSSKFRDVECQTDYYLDRDKHIIDHNLNVNKILGELLMEDCADYADTLVYSCSGGEQKRLSIGLELVQQSKPNLMCIDEPTSGLDSNASKLVIQCIKHLSDRHRMAIVTSIHQPNSLLLYMYDQLYVLSKGGHCVFTGPPNQLRKHLLDCDISCPQDTVFEIRKLLDKTEISSQEIIEFCRLNDKLVPKDNNKVIDNQSVYFSFYHIYYLLFRGFTCFIRLDYIIGLGFCLNVTMTTTNSTSMKQVSLEQAMKIIDQNSDVVQNSKCLFFSVVIIGFLTMSCSVLSFPHEVRVFLNEHKNKWYSTGSYYWAKSLTDLPMIVTVAIIYSTIMYYGTGQLNEMFRYYYFTIIMVL